MGDDNSKRHPAVGTEDATYVSAKAARRKLAGPSEGVEEEEPKDVKTVPKQIVIPKLDIRIMKIKLVGDASLIVHRFSEKQKKLMLDKQMGVPNEGREPKDPHQDFLDSLYTDKTGKKYYFPAIGFKSAAVTACTSLSKAITKVKARQAFHVIGDMVEIHGEPTMREDCVRVGQGTADLRYRAEFKTWHCELTIRYNARLLTPEQIINLFNVAGFGVGVGEWRVERDGQFGLFHVE